MKNLNCIQIEIFINLEIIGEDDKNKKNYIYIYIYININLTKFLQFREVMWRNYSLSPTFII